MRTAAIAVFVATHLPGCRLQPTGRSVYACVTATTSRSASRHCQRISAATRMRASRNALRRRRCISTKIQGSPSIRWFRTRVSSPIQTSRQRSAIVRNMSPAVHASRRNTSRATAVPCHRRLPRLVLAGLAFRKPAANVVVLCLRCGRTPDSRTIQ